MQDSKLFKIVASTIESNAKLILPFVRETIGPASLSALKQDEAMRMLAIHLHGRIPFYARTVIRRDRFVDFIMNNKTHVINLLEPLLKESDHSNETTP